MNSSPRVLIVGCGDVGSRLGLQLAALGWAVYGLRRQVQVLPAGIVPVRGDLDDPALPAGWPAGRLDYLVYATAASQHDEPGYRRAYVDGLTRTLDWLAAQGQRPRRLVFVSSTGVYGQDQGEWVDETSPTEPSAFSGRILLEAERLAGNSGLPATCVRLAGIYGPGRRWLLDQVRQGYRVPPEPPQYGNRIHADDAAGLIAFLLQRDAAGQPVDGCYLGVDDEPAPLHEVVDWLRARLNVTAEAQARVSRRLGSKRCRNTRARAQGWLPRYPSYREGYAALIGAEGVELSER